MAKGRGKNRNPSVNTKKENIERLKEKAKAASQECRGSVEGYAGRYV